MPLELRLSWLEVLYAVGLLLWVIIVVQLISKGVYELGRRRYGDEKVGIYFARKAIHMLAGGLVAILVAVLDPFETPIMPLFMGILLAFFCWWPHHTGKLMYWFQDPENMYEVDFCLVWAFLMSLGWLLAQLYNPALGWWLGTVPVLFMAFGDGITGIVRNFLFKKRTKHWSGNVAMFFLCAPMGYFIGPFYLAGIIAAAISSAVEHVERIGSLVIDDNVTVPLAAFAVLALFTVLDIPYMLMLA